MALSYQDAVLNVLAPEVTQTVDGFPAVLAELRAGLPVTSGPIGVVGASVGALPAQLVIASGAAQVSATALISPVIELAEVVPANERRFNVSYPWSQAAQAVAARFDFAARAGEIAAADPQPAILLAREISRLRPMSSCNSHGLPVYRQRALMTTAYSAQCRRRQRGRIVLSALPARCTRSDHVHG